MKTTKQVISDSRIPSSLVNAVVRQLGGKESLTDIYNYGIDGGFHGFIYYSETIAFFKRNRKAITQLVEDMANDLGKNPVDMVAGFNCLDGRDMQQLQAGNAVWITADQRRRARDRDHILSEHRPSITRCLYGGRLTDDDTQVANALAWFAGEEVARAFCDE